jgi:hypothetical protein
MQLSVYRFTRGNDDAKGAYKNPHFVKHMKYLCQKMTPEKIKMETEDEKEIVNTMLCKNEGSTCWERPLAISRDLSLSKMGSFLAQEFLTRPGAYYVTSEDVNNSRSCSSSVVAETNPQTAMTSQQQVASPPPAYSNKKGDDAARILSLPIPNNNNVLLDPSLFSLGKNNAKTAEQREENRQESSSMLDDLFSVPLSSELEPTPFPEPTANVTTDDWSFLFSGTKKKQSSASNHDARQRRLGDDVVARREPTAADHKDAA